MSNNKQLDDDDDLSWTKKKRWSAVCKECFCRGGDCIPCEGSGFVEAEHETGIWYEEYKDKVVTK